MKGPDPNPSASGAPFRLIQPAQGFTSWSLSSEYTMYKDPGYRVSAEPYLQTRCCFPTPFNNADQFDRHIHVKTSDSCSLRSLDT